MEWVRGDQLGCGNFATINLAILTKGFDQFPPLMAVKTSPAISSVSLKNEKQILDQIGNCPQIITCFGDGFTVERDGQKHYNLFLEYAKGGSLADRVKIHSGGLPEYDVRRYTTAVLNGLKFIHGNGFVHCDIKLANILTFNNGGAKIADFGLAKKAKAETEQKFEWRGTPLYMSPESVNSGQYAPPCDIWALGCAVVEMVAGKPAWNVRPQTNIFGLMMRIGVGEEVPDLPENLSEEGKDFLRRCFIKDPKERWTAEMLLNHQFAAAGNTVTLKKNETESAAASPRGPFDFPEFASFPSDSDERCFSAAIDLGSDFASAMSTVGQLGTEKAVDWSVSDSWVTVR